MEENTQQAVPTGAERKADPWRSDEIGELCKALAQCQAEIKNPKKSKTANAGKFKYNYADISDVLACINSVAPKFGLAHTQVIRPNHEGRSCIFTMVMHESGQWLCSEYKLPPASDNHEMGGNITYGRRYALAPMFGIASEEDTDFNGDHGKTEEVEAAAQEKATKKAEAIAEGYRSGRWKKVPAAPATEDTPAISTQAAPVETEKAVATEAPPEKGNSLRARLAASKAKAAQIAKEQAKIEKDEADAIAEEGSAPESRFVRVPVDYSGIHKGLAAKLKDYDDGVCNPVAGFEEWVRKTGALGPQGMDAKDLPDDFCEQVLSQWEKVAPKFEQCIVPF